MNKQYSTWDMEKYLDDKFKGVERKEEDELERMSKQQIVNEIKRLKRQICKLEKYL